MPAKVAATHHFSGNETASQSTPYNPGTYDPPYPYPAATSYTPSAVAALAAAPSAPNAEPPIHRKLLKKFLRKQSSDPVPLDFIDWEAIVADTGDLSRYPALSVGSSPSVLHAHPHQRLPEGIHGKNDERPDIRSISDHLVMKNPSRTLEHVEQDSYINSYSASNGGLSEKTHWAKESSASSRRGHGSHSSRSRTKEKSSSHRHAHSSSKAPCNNSSRSRRHSCSSSDDSSHRHYSRHRRSSYVSSIPPTSSASSARPPTSQTGSHHSYHSIPFSTPAHFVDMKNHGRLINAAVDPSFPVSEQFLARNPESTGYYQYAGWQPPPLPLVCSSSGAGVKSKSADDQGSTKIWKNPSAFL